MDGQEKTVRDYLSTNHILWPQYFDDRGARNELGVSLTSTSSLPRPA
jgi:hypothetical protein